MVFKQHLARAGTRVAAGLLALASLASCGGGTHQATTFQPERILSFGDENSLLTADGHKYTVMGLNTLTQVIDCASNPIWIQSLASAFGLVYDQCNPEAVASPAAHTYAQLNATVDMVSQQLQTFQASDSFTPNDLITIWVGMHDVLAVYAETATSDETAVLAEMRTRAIALANQVNTITATGAKVLLLTVPLVGQTPFGVKENDRNDFDRALLLTHMTQEFNRALRTNILNDGSKIGLVLADDYINSVVRVPTAYGYTVADQAGCLDTAPLPSCTTDTVQTTVNATSTTASSFVWADSLRLNYPAHAAIGSQSISRVRSNPF